MKKKNFITNTDIYELIGKTAEALIQLQTTKNHAIEGDLIDRAVESQLIGKGLNSVVEEIKRNGKELIPFMESEIVKQEQALKNLISQLD